MKKIFAIISIVLLFSVLVLAGCQNEEKPEYFDLSKDGATNYVIVNLLSDKSYANDLAKNLKIKSGASFSVVDKPQEGKNAIYLGTDEQLASYGATPANLLYTAYQVAISNNDLYIALPDEQFAGEVILKMKEKLVKVADGQVSLDKSWLGEHNVANISENIPEFVTAKGELKDVHDCGSGNFLLTYEKVSSSTEPITYEYSLIDAGYTLVQANDVGNNRFVTYIKGDTMVHCTYFAANFEYRIVYGPKTYLGDMQPVTDYEDKVTPSVSMVEISGTGLSMVVQLADGSFIVIDGGHGQKATETQKNQDMERLYNFLADNTPGGGKPQITWMITHADPDHIALPTAFIGKYADKIDVNMVCYNFPNMTNIGLGEGNSNKPETFVGYVETFISSVTNNFPDAKHYISHTGSKLYLPGCEIEFLFNASEDYYPAVMPYCNHTSNAWRLTIEGKTILITGDIETGLSNKIAKIYGDYLKSDVLQVVHHGVNGASSSLYNAIQPSVCFWPIRKDNDNYKNGNLLGQNGKYPFNAVLWSSAKDHYFLSETTTILLPSLELKK